MILEQILHRSLDNNNILTFWKQWIEKSETREKKKKNYCLRNND